MNKGQGSSCLFFFWLVVFYLEDTIVVTCTVLFTEVVSDYEMPHTCAYVYNHVQRCNARSLYMYGTQ